MRKIAYNNKIIVLLFLLAICSSCSDEFLEQKPNTNIVAPQTLEDYQMMLDFWRLNKASSLGQLAADEYYLATETDWLNSRPIERNTYVWNQDIFGGQQSVDDWNFSYESVFYANSILDGLKSMEITDASQQQYDNIKGQAYFMRAFAFFDLAKNFAPPYDNETALTELGIPLKTSPNVDEIMPRSTVQETYEQIIADLRLASALLPNQLPLLKNRASKPAAYALFARLYLSMREYDLAEIYADSCLLLYNSLMDYNGINKTTGIPFPIEDNTECLFYSTYGVNYDNALYEPIPNVGVSPELLGKYGEHDLRRSVFYTVNTRTGLTKVKRGYSGRVWYPFSGLATDEIYLIKAESAARLGGTDEALAALNTLLSKRWEEGFFTPYSGLDKEELLRIVLEERQKELVWRAGLRWDDLRRLNKEGAGITLSRTVGNTVYTLTPNDRRYTFPIPLDEITRSGIQQNER
ncbi:RagB/SusD family nutrient uptake outer membrane protein [Olivibacter sp. XZL3]|uniref:RagB/SusD family nutrient uptake outer membrane protein n=1 Tax=Olivibacter sp. XZL3 TaxID=1735116 RepID=UPI001064C7DC|nr:RagB/SusD family nutrient uptake outer membrane protein [Olivibacter sp. XZL3]